MPIRLHLNPPRPPSSPQQQSPTPHHHHHPRPHHPTPPLIRMDRRDSFAPQIDLQMFESIIYSIETSIHNLLLSQEGPHRLSNSHFPALQIIEPLQGLGMMFQNLHSVIESYAERTKILERYELRYNKWMAACKPGSKELGRRLSRVIRRIPYVDHAYVLSFTGFNMHITAAQERLVTLSRFLDAVLHPEPLEDPEDRMIMPMRDLNPFPYATQPIIAPEGTPGWKMLLQKYGVENLHDYDDETKRILTQASDITNGTRKWMRKCREMCEREGQKTLEKNVIWEDWKETVVSFEEGGEVDEEVEMEMAY